MYTYVYISICIHVYMYTCISYFLQEHCVTSSSIRIYDRFRSMILLGRTFFSTQGSSFDRDRKFRPKSKVERSP